jgi:hypothetical protein
MEAEIETRLISAAVLAIMACYVSVRVELNVNENLGKRSALSERPARGGSRSLADDRRVAARVPSASFTYALEQRVGLGLAR